MAAGDYLIISRSASQAAFEDYWGVTLGDNVTFVNSGDVLPQINGDETYTVKNGSGTVVDGPTIAMTSGEYMSRSAPSGAANDENSWSTGSNTVGGSVTPGSGQSIGQISTGLYISEVSDASGSGNYIFEYVELFFDGGEE